MLAQLSFRSRSQQQDNFQEERGALEELKQFLAKPQSIGVDSLKRSMRNLVMYMIEMTGEDHGLARHVFRPGRGESLAVAGSFKESDAKREAKRREFLLLLRLLEAEMAKQFRDLFEYTHERIHQTKNLIDLELEKAKQELKDAKAGKSGGFSFSFAGVANDAAAAAGAAVAFARSGGTKTVADEKVQAAKDKVSALSRLQRVFKKHDRELNKAETSEDIIEVQQRVIEDEERVEQVSKGFFKKSMEIARKATVSSMKPIRNALTALRYAIFRSQIGEIDVERSRPEFNQQSGAPNNDDGPESNYDFDDEGTEPSNEGQS
ncbi:MAG: hypothetical protein GC137_00935 [Alphaproteobacteria bacterium]|nr:hypothetical protein [Alphaproteobacteria bacterium]